MAENLSDQSLFMDLESGNMRSMNIAGQTLQILDYGYICGRSDVAVILSDYNVIFSTKTCGATVCSTCFHTEGPRLVPDYVACPKEVMTPYGIMVLFKPPWMMHCLGLLNYESISGNFNALEAQTLPFLR